MGLCKGERLRKATSKSELRGGHLRGFVKERHRCCQYFASGRLIRSRFREIRTFQKKNLECGLLLLNSPNVGLLLIMHHGHYCCSVVSVNNKSNVHKLTLSISRKRGTRAFRLQAGNAPERRENGGGAGEKLRNLPPGSFGAHGDRGVPASTRRQRAPTHTPPCNREPRNTAVPY